MGGTAEMEAVDAGGMAALPAAAQRADGALFLVACGESLALGHAAVCSALVLFHRVNQAHKRCVLSLRLRPPSRFSSSS